MYTKIVRALCKLSTLVRNGHCSDGGGGSGHCS